MQTVNISQKQAREFARLIYKDIRKFCEEHREEFELFLQNEEKSEVKVNGDSEKAQQSTVYKHTTGDF